MKTLRKRGFSILELLIAMALLLVIIVGVLGVFYDMMRIRKRTDILLGVQQNARFSILTITNKVQMTGYQTPLDSALIPDPRCEDETGSSSPGNIPEYCNIPNRVQSTDGIVVFTSIEDRRFMKPYCVAAEPSCSDSGTFCPAPPIFGNEAHICTPSGYRDNELAGQPFMVCGPIADINNAQGCDWVVPDPMPPIFLNECLQASAFLCCSSRMIQTGPVCDPPACIRDVATGSCGDPMNCAELITTIGDPFPVFSNSPVRCIFVPPVQAIHYQIHQDPNNPQQRYLMVRVNNAIDDGGNPLWQPVAANIVDLQTCYVLDAQCDPLQQCRRWQWTQTGGAPFLCSDTGAPASVRNIRRVMIQVTARTAEPIIQSAEFTENPPCIPGSTPPPLPPAPNENAVWRQYTLCNEIIARNLTYKELTPPTIW